MKSQAARSRSSSASSRLVRCSRATVCHGKPVRAPSSAQSRLRLTFVPARLALTYAPTEPTLRSWASVVIPARARARCDFGPRFGSSESDLVAAMVLESQPPNAKINRRARPQGGHKRASVFNEMLERTRNLRPIAWNQRQELFDRSARKWLDHHAHRVRPLS